MKRMIAFYDSEVDRFEHAHSELDKKERDSRVDDFIDTNPALISWSVNLKQELAKCRRFSFDAESLSTSLYRPFGKQWLYFNRSFNERVYQMPCLLPDAAAENIAIMIKGNWRGDGQLALMINRPVCLQPDGGGQCFPLYLYAKADEATDDELFPMSPVASTETHTRRDGITDAGLSHFQQAYPAKAEGDRLTKEDLFFYIYGLLHSPDYRNRFADNLGKELPRIPAVKKFADFQAFAQAGRDLAHWHLNYETVACYPVTFELTGGATKLKTLQPEQFRVVKMKFPRRKDPDTGKSVSDKSTVIYNEFITVTGIPLEAYDYVVNGKPAIEWVMERQAVTTDKDSGIVNDANLWATETMHNPRYPLELLQRVITVSLETMKLVNNLPKLDID